MSLLSVIAEAPAPTSQLRWVDALNEGLEVKILKRIVQYSPLSHHPVLVFVDRERERELNQEKKTDEILKFSLSSLKINLLLHDVKSRACKCDCRVS